MGSTVQQTMVPDNWNFNGRYPCLYHGGNYNQNQNHGPFYITALAEEKPTGHSLVHFGPGLALEHPAALERL